MGKKSKIYSHKGPSTRRSIVADGRESYSASLRGPTKKEKAIAEQSSIIYNHIKKILKKAGIYADVLTMSRLYCEIVANKGVFKKEFFKEVGIDVDKQVLLSLYSTLPKIFDGGDSLEHDVVNFDRDMEAFLKRIATGTHIFLYFMRARSSYHKIWHTTFAHVQNHCQLGRLMDILDNTPHENGFIGFSALPFHMVIEGDHFDCVPLEVGDLPVEWVLRAAVHDCKCDTQNWGKSAFVGTEWLGLGDRVEDEVVE